MTGTTESEKKAGGMSVSGAAFLGIGAMVGAGIFALLGEAGAVAGAAVWLSFLLAGVVAGLLGYASSSSVCASRPPAGSSPTSSRGLATAAWSGSRRGSGTCPRS